MVVLLLLLAGAAAAQDFRVYVGSLKHDSVILAWGKTTGDGNTIGRDSKPYGKAQVKVGDRTASTESHNWLEVDGLKPDTEYPYEISVNGNKIGDGRVRTWAEKASKLAFFVIGDFGTGASSQDRIAEAMAREYEKRRASDNPVRFVLTTGDNIYADVNWGYIIRGSGDADRHWEKKFFRPYERLLREIPFYPTIGNHDGNATENRADLPVYLDNFFFQDGKAHRWYSFNYGGLAEFFALDSSDNSEEGRRTPVYLKEGEQTRWLNQHLNSKAPWKIPYFHHPPFNAGPGHPAYYESLKHWAEAFQQAGVRVVFNGHEHNFQFTYQNRETNGIRWVISGAGGELRANNILARMSGARMEGWAPQRHFLAVEIDGRTMRITPFSYEKVTVRGAEGKEFGMPLVVNLP